MTNYSRLMKVFGIAAAATLLALPLSHAQTTSTTTSTTRAGATDTGTVKINKDDHKRIKDIAEANLAEIEVGNLALTKSRNSQVRSFAQKLIDDHTKAQRELQSLAQSKGVTIPTETDTLHKTISALLKALSGNTFDKHFISRVGVGDHQRTHDLLQETINDASDADLKAYAQKTLPVIDQHLNMAKGIENSMKKK